MQSQSRPRCLEEDILKKQTTCIHESQRYMSVPVDSLGEIIILICENCSHISSECAHSNNSWVGEVSSELDGESEESLICNLCGMDVT